MARVQAAWRRYASLRQSRRRALAKSAQKYVETGKERYRKSFLEFKKISDSVIRQSNLNMRNLEKAELDYGKPYNSLNYYITSELGTRRLPSTNSLIAGNYNETNDDQWFIAVEQGLKFLRSPLSTVKGMEESNEARFKTLQDKGVLPTVGDEGNDITWRNERGFLRFLGSEEIASAIDEYGESDIVVDMLWDYWNNDTNNRVNNVALLKQAMAMYLSGSITFDEAMGRRGVKIEDYISRKYSR